MPAIISRLLVPVVFFSLVVLAVHVLLTAAGEIMVSGVTGEEFAAEIFIGPVYYQRLRHMVSDKFQVGLWS